MVRRSLSACRRPLCHSFGSYARTQDRGNKAFSENNYPLALKFFSKAIEEKPDDHLLYSNRSATFVQLHNGQKALEDADTCIKLQPNWFKVPLLLSFCRFRALLLIVLLCCIPDRATCVAATPWRPCAICRRR